tara:strand:+ start:3689 stop:3985 length:297 start_codon:yes stop_codon:yes gene_type:complete
MAKGYVIGQIEINDLEAYKKYPGKAQETVEQYGGRYMVRGGPLVSIEGDAPLSRIVVLEFPSYERAQEWYNSDDYQAVIGLRHAAAYGHMFIVEGHDG